MKISQVKISNFRGYKDETVIEFNDLTVFVGKNNVGKSTVLEALDIFFNEGKGVIKLDKDDINKQGQSNDGSNYRNGVNRPSDPIFVLKFLRLFYIKKICVRCFIAVIKKI